ncbi:MAG: hypothetical protein ACLR8P_23100 [Clostridium fessum]
MQAGIFWTENSVLYCRKAYFADLECGASAKISYSLHDLAKGQE